MTSTAARRPRIVPDAYLLLANWRYVEHALLRIIAGWGRCAGDWEDKLAVCYHTWLQAETVERMRQRLDMFPGGKKDPSVNAAFERAANAVIEAPSFRDAMAGVYEILVPAMNTAYAWYIAATHPVHDRPTADLLRQTLESRRTQLAWYARFAARLPHKINPAYAQRIGAALAAIGALKVPIEPGDDLAQNCGVRTRFALPQTPGRVKNWDKAPNIMPFLELDWSHSVEARRLFFMIGYCWEMGVAEQQLRWIYNADFMPFEFVHNEARHMWDESRHGDSGYQRLKDFGLDFEHFGYSSYGATGDGVLPAMTPTEVYEEFYHITQLAETGYFETKRYCFEDFDVAGDDASAEMMQFDIIDETSHVEYGRLWLETIAAKAGVQEDYRKRGAAERAHRRTIAAGRVDAYRKILAADPAAPTVLGDTLNRHADAAKTLRDPQSRAHYQWLLEHLRAKCPVKNADRAPLRPALPM